MPLIARLTPPPPLIRAALLDTVAAGFEQETWLWLQREQRTPDPASGKLRLCLRGALSHIAPRDWASLEDDLRPHMTDAPEALANPKSGRTCFSPGCIPCWNDDASRTLDDVIQLCRIAAQHLANTSIAATEAQP